MTSLEQTRPALLARHLAAVWWLALALPVGCSAGEDHGHQHTGGHEHGGSHDDHSAGQDDHSAGHDDHSAGHDDPAGGHDERGGHGHGHGDEGGLPGTTITHFARSQIDGSETELFVEFGPLIVGEETAFAAHFTDCGGLWTAVAEGALVVELSTASGAAETFETRGPTVPGIFRPVAKPKTAGPRKLRFHLARGARVHVHDVGDVTVYPNRAAAEKALGGAEEGGAEEGGDDGSISFLKEQAWKLDFALAEVTKEPVSPSVRVFGELVPRSDGRARVTASASGRLVGAKGGLPRVGTVVEKGTLLATLVPSVSGGGNLAAILLQKEKATIAASTAQREVDRLTSLVEQGAVPARRLQEAEAAVARATAERASAERLLAQYQGSVSGGRAPGGLQIVAPIRGVLTDVPVVAGSYVEAGEKMFEIVDTSVLWLVARVPEVKHAEARQVFGGAFRLPGGQWRDLAVADGGVAPSAVLDEADRTFPLRLPIENADATLPAGAKVVVDLAVAAPADRLSMPAGAVVYEQGAPVAYVMVEGESFARRPLTLGGEVGARVLVDKGVKAGERVVSTGAMYVKLASSSGAAPAHGHAH